jgi:hypothetical protein
MRLSLKQIGGICLPALFAFASPLALAGPAEVFAYVNRSCKGCHNASVSSGGLSLAGLDNAKSFGEHRDVWERVASRIATGQMPPPNLPQPPAAETAAVTRWLESEFARQDKAAKPDPGRVAARRLNRAEYNNTIRDLLAVNISPAENFPQDETAFGFDNNGDALNVSPVLLEKYVDAAERVVRTAIFGPPKMKPAMTHYPSPVRIPKLPPSLMEYDLTGLSTHHATHVTHRFPVDGVYSFKLVLNGHRPNQSEAVTAAFWIDGKKIQQFEVDATDLEGQICEVRARVTAGEHLLSASYLRQYEGLPERYNGPNPSKRPPEPLISARGQLTEKDIETLRKFGTKIKTDRIDVRVDNRFESMDVGGPFEQTLGPSAESLQLIFACGHPTGKHTSDCPRRILSSFAPRAFRRPLTAKEVEPFLNIYALVRKQGDSFEEGIAAAMEAILVSPYFLFRIESARTQTASALAPLGDFELASRLSYFLWSSMPDSELLRVAGEGRLRQPAVLTAQVKRMLKDAKSQALVENFAGQWLQFKNIDVMKPDGERFMDFDESLRHSMRRETELFIGNLIAQDASVLDLIDCNYTFLDERLARFYGVPGVIGPQFRRVDMSKTQRGGGILSQASILTISSYSTRTSPVLRGKWVLENILNAPPPPPPPSVPALDDTTAGQTASLRQQMEAHRKSAACASCHASMDPLGFGLENFDAIGAWRTVDGKFPVDASGTMPGGKSFNGPAELKDLLKQNREVFLRGLTEKMLTYALGRGLERYDRPAVSAIAAKLPANNYRFSELVLGIANSLPFQMKHATDGGSHQ